MATQKKGGKNGSRKIGRMKAKCEAYKQNKTREKNKIRKITKYLKSHPKNAVAETRLYELQAIVAGQGK